MRGTKELESLRCSGNEVSDITKKGNSDKHIRPLLYNSAQ